MKVLIRPLHSQTAMINNLLCRKSFMNAVNEMYKKENKYGE